jgi:oligogalacturonide lyase
LELKGGALKPLTAAAALHPRALALSPDDKTLYFTDGDRLLATASSSLSKPRELYRATSPEVWSRGFSLCEDGSTLTFFDGAKLMALNPKTPGKPTPQVITEANPEATEALAFKGNQVIFRDPQKGFHAYFPALGPKPLRLSLEGQFGPAYWNPDGRSFLFLRTNQGPGKANSLHEYSFDTKQESLVGRTSQFVHFNRNADSSVFVGASGSKAQPYLLLMLRITRRELALCEHKASDATMVAPVFSPSSKRVFFVTDRLGKPAIFSMMVDRLVEPTEADEPEKKS